MSNFLKARLYLYRTEEDIENALLQLGLYMVFTIVTTIICLSTPTSEVFFFSESLDSLFLRSEKHFETSYEHIVTLEDWLKFTEGVFLRNLETIESKQRAEKGASKPLKIGENYVIGTPRLRQIRVQKEECTVHPQLKTKFDDCYPRYSYEKENTTDIYRGTRYLERKYLELLPYKGFVERYNGPGYVKLLSFDQVKNAKTFEEIIETEWFDSGTRLVLLEMFMYNPDVLLFGTLRLIAELMPTGTIIPNWELNMIPLTAIWSPNRPTILAVSIIFYLLVLYYTSLEIQELLDSGAKRYFLNAQNTVDMIILMTSYIMLKLSTQRAFNMHRFLNKIAQNSVSFLALDNIYLDYTTLIVSMAICVFLVWSKLLRFIGFTKVLLQFRTTLMKCYRDIVGFAVMFLIVFMAFALCGMLICGGTIPDFKTFHNALFSMVRMVLGDFEYTKIEYANRVLCPVFYLFYVVFISFILLNMFLAIINNTYIDVKQEVIDDESALKRFFLKYARLIKEKFKNPKKQTVQRGSIDLSQQADAQSIYEYEDIGFTNVTTGRRDSIVNILRRPFEKPYVISDKRPSAQDNMNEDLIRLSERVGLLEDLIAELKPNIDRIVGRARPSLATRSNEES